jgi:3-hydroxybutyrate dehydrogenase
MNLQYNAPRSGRAASGARQGLLTDKVAVITGAASGIGKEIAFAFAREGAKVAIADLNQQAADKAASEIDPRVQRALGVAMDVSDEQQVEAGMARVLETFGRIDVLISNAGVQIVAPVVDLEFASWKKLLAIHLDGAFLTTRAALRHMYVQKSGSIIYMGSVHSKEASPLKAPYVTAKHGLIGLAKVVAKEGAAHGVRANVICPGFVRTPLVEKQIPEQARKLGISEAEVVKNVMLKETVDGEFTTAQDVAETAVFLAAFPSNALTGQSVVVSHGWFMQ